MRFNKDHYYLDENGQLQLRDIFCKMIGRDVARYYIGITPTHFVREGDDGDWKLYDELNMVEIPLEKYAVEKCEGRFDHWNIARNALRDVIMAGHKTFNPPRIQPADVAVVPLEFEKFSIISSKLSEEDKRRECNLRVSWHDITIKGQPCPFSYAYRGESMFGQPCIDFHREIMGDNLVRQQYDKVRISRDISDAVLLSNIQTKIAHYHNNRMFGTARFSTGHFNLENK